MRAANTMPNDVREPAAPPGSDVRRTRWAFFAARPMLFGVAAVALTLGIARVINTLAPRTPLPLIPGYRVHHYVFGIFILTIAGYLALLFKGPRATFGIALLYGLGVGLVFDEFGLWFNPPRTPLTRVARWDVTGVLAIAGFFAATALLQLWLNARKR
jgi:hypothetical protein